MHTKLRVLYTCIVDIITMGYHKQGLPGPVKDIRSVIKFHSFHPKNKIYYYLKITLRKSVRLCIEIKDTRVDLKLHLGKY